MEKRNELITKLENECIAAEKNFVADYLENCSFYPDLCKNHSDFLRQESEYWEKLSDYYKIFMRRGIYLSEFRADYIMNHMENIMDKVLIVEQKIIDTSIK